MRNGPTRACACIQSLLKVKSPFPEAAILYYCVFIAPCMREQFDQVCFWGPKFLLSKKTQVKT